MKRFYTNFTMHMGNVLLREVVGGKHVNTRIKCKPYLFVPKETGDYRTIHGDPVIRVDFESTKKAREFIEKYRDTKNYEVYGSTSYAYPFINDRYPGDIDFDPKLICTAYIDLEVKSNEGFPDPEKAEKEITAIALSINGKMYTFSCVDYVPAAGITYHKCKNEVELLEKFLDTWCWEPIDVCVGWNIDLFDAPYLINRITKILGEDAARLLSPWRQLEKRKTFIKGREYEMWTIVGITIFDYMKAYKQFTHKPQESYSLNNISHVVLDEKKVDYSEYTSLHDLYVNNPQLFMEYNVKDVTLMEKLDAKLGLLYLVYTIAYYCKVTFDDAFGTVKMWESMIHNELMKDKIVVQMNKSSTKAEFAGGYVKEVQVGKHDWVVSFDFTSLYPHLIMALNISPETLVGSITRLSVEELLEGKLDGLRSEIGDNSVSGSCHLYTKSKHGFFPKLMENLYTKRAENNAKAKAAKKRLEEDDTLTPEERNKLEIEESRLHNLQLAMKYALNSGYGAMSNVYFTWFDMRMAESVTLSGQVAVQWVSKRINDYLEKITGIKDDFIVAMDTDSAYVNLGPLVKMVYGDKASTIKPSEVTEFLDKICKEKIVPVIAAACDSWCEYMNAYANKLHMKREKIAMTGIWTAKKKYALYVTDDEGARLKEPELIVKGLDVVKSSTPSICKDKMKDAIVMMMNGTEAELQDYVAKFKEEFYGLPFHDVASPRGVNGIATYDLGQGKYKSGVPLHTRGAIVYNNTIDKLGLTNTHFKIQDGDKIKYCYMKSNPTGENVISCPAMLPREMGLDSYIDYDTQFEKAFLQPIRQLLNAIGWSDTKKFTLGSFF